MNMIEIQDAVLDHLKATDLPNVWEGAVPAGFALPKQNGAYLPYAVVSFGGKTQVAQPNQGITGTRDDMKWSSVAVEVVGQSARDVRVAGQVVRDALEGYEPDPAWGQLSERLAGDYQVLKPEYELWPVRHATGIVFSVMVDAVS